MSVGMQLTIPGGLNVTSDASLFSAKHYDIVVMKRGEVVDRGEREYILHQSTHPYTKLLLDAVPTLGGRRYV